MGNGVSRAFAGCFVPLPVHNTREHSNALFSQPSDEGLGHSFCYIRPSEESPLHIAHSHLISSDSLQCKENGNSPDCAPAPGHGSNHSHSHIDYLKLHSETTFKAISGASVSANTSTPCTIVCHDQIQTFTTVSDDKAAAFECTPSFASLPLQPIPKGINSNPSIFSGPISLPLDRGLFSGPLDRGLPSGPLERGFLSGPLERSCMSGPIDMSFDPSHFSAPLPGSYVNYIGNKRRVAGLIDGMRKPVERVLNGATSRMKAMHSHVGRGAKSLHDPSSIVSIPLQDDETRNWQWAHGKAGEDRVHVVLSDKHGWLFVGIYDGFNGPDAPDFLMGNLYATIYKELQGLLWDIEEGFGSTKEKPDKAEETRGPKMPQHLTDRNQAETFDSCFSNGHCENVDQPNKRNSQTQQRSFSPKIFSLRPKKGTKPRRGMSFPSSHHLRDKENYMRFSDSYSSLHRDRNNNGVKSCRAGGADHSAVLRALAHALEETEKAYLDMADRALNENPELALMGSCILVMLMKDEDVYVMNVGDSRAIIGQHRKYVGHHKRRFSQEDLQSCNINVDCMEKIGARDSMIRVDLERIIEESPYADVEAFEAAGSNNPSPTSNLMLSALQLSKDHCTSVEEEIRRIKAEHPDDNLSIVNDRVKGTLKVTRAFGAGFLKKPQWNSAILEMFRINYVGSAPYISCTPSLRHHRLSQNDRFLILSSDGLYQYLSNQEVVSHVEWFMEMFPEGDPAQHLVEELLFRAAKKAGMDFHQLLDVPQGDRRKYHDDVSVMVISLQGRIWRSCS